jgi:hypothetical protein
MLQPRTTLTPGSAAGAALLVTAGFAFFARPRHGATHVPRAAAAQRDRSMLWRGAAPTFSFASAGSTQYRGGGPGLLVHSPPPASKLPQALHPTMLRCTPSAPTRLLAGAARRIWGAAPQTAPDLTVPMELTCMEPLFESPTPTKVHRHVPTSGGCACLTNSLHARDPLAAQTACSDLRVTAALPSQVTTLKNGLKVASADMTMPSTSIGLYIDTGSRYDVVSGTAHMLQHMAFKVRTLRARRARCLRRCAQGECAAASGMLRRG